MSSRSLATKRGNAPHVPDTGTEPLRPPQAILFDLDGVLADVSRSYRQCVITTAATYGVAVEPEEILEMKAAGNANNDWELTRRLLLRRGVDPPLEEVTSRFEEVYQGTASRPGLRRTERLICDTRWIDGLRAECPLGIVTGRPRRDAMRFLDENGIGRFFDALVCMEDGPLKPDPAPVRAAMALLEVEVVWFVGDTPDDMRAGRGAGQQPLGIVAPGDDERAVIPTLLHAGAARILSRIEEIEDLLP